MKSIKNLLLSKQVELNQLLSKTEKSLEKAPEGALTVSYSKGTPQYYHRTKDKIKSGKYIQKKEKKLIASLAQKDYDIKFEKVLLEQKNTLSKILKQLPTSDLTDVYVSLSKERKELVKPYILTDEQYVEQWLNKKYNGKKILPDTPVFITERGETVRSKIEKILADKFYSMGIPYRYEYPVKLKGYGVVYPDFTLLDVVEREECYFEHFGMMDNEEYCKKAILKLENYARNGIFPGKNLLITFETLQTPLDMKVVEKMLKQFIVK